MMLSFNDFAPSRFGILLLFAASGGFFLALDRLWLLVWRRIGHAHAV